MPDAAGKLVKSDLKRLGPHYLNGELIEWIYLLSLAVILQHDRKCSIGIGFVRLARGAVSARGKG